jgi:hypothetical protein
VSVCSFLRRLINLSDRLLKINLGESPKNNELHFRHQRKILRKMQFLKIFDLEGLLDYEHPIGDFLRRTILSIKVLESRWLKKNLIVNFQHVKPAIPLVDILNFF